ncbi:MAG: hypothetical protein AB9907_13475 [Flexilinea sp.]
MTTTPDFFPDNSDIVVLACNSLQYIDVLAINGKTVDGEIFTYIRSPLSDFSCPVSEPVCTDIDTCY